LSREKTEEAIEDSIYLLMREFGWTLDEVRKLSIPSYFELLETMERVKKREVPDEMLSTKDKVKRKMEEWKRLKGYA